ncbi:hypothetical protein BOX15_Mlig034260g1 [Macrostomum lignano]|uniref:Probable imidazolonepropionase n=1 Tax=Macrostomum lignano TaxID=282301 RepID=A0A267GQU5_9PLAT|nr:hypothetical protein BOX15_Mlig034260g3 [Macrostomum lignano]PAA87784.1 hypothetical protein BOX15_Mlig034260g1 [Macrostomum lignano]
MSSSTNSVTLVHSASQLVQVVADGRTRLRGSEMRHPVVHGEPGINYALAFDMASGRIVDLGPTAAVESRLQASGCTVQTRVDATDCVIMPGFVDAHTHPVWAGDRVHEFAMKLAGATYMDIHAAGGGIHFTVRETARATDRELADLLSSRLASMSRHGTTLAEVKSGYGLTLDAELRLLQLLCDAAADPLCPVRLSVTYLAGHAVPPGRDSAEFAAEVASEHVPRVLAERKISGRLSAVRQIDVFCERGVLNAAESARILEAALPDLRGNVHADELSDQDGAAMACRSGAAAASHLEFVSESGISAMASNDCSPVAVLLPTTARLLHLPAPPARRMIDSGCAVGLGSDFNPNAHCLSMPLIGHMACVDFGLSMEEALAACTINAAAALGLSDQTGSLEVGKLADFVLLRAPRWEHAFYQVGDSDSLVKLVCCGGRLVKKG